MLPDVLFPGKFEVLKLGKVQYNKELFKICTILNGI
jgi:hypothetical protein